MSVRRRRTGDHGHLPVNVRFVHNPTGALRTMNRPRPSQAREAGLCVLPLSEAPACRVGGSRQVARPAPQSLKTDRLSRKSEEYPIIVRQFAQCSVEIWVYETGQPLKVSTYLLQWNSLAERAEKWAAFEGDPAWQAALAEARRCGPLADHAEDVLLTATHDSPLR